MNFTEFIRKTDNITGNMPPENLAHSCTIVHASFWGIKGRVSGTLNFFFRFQYGNEEYDDWYSEGEEFFYEDPENICVDIEEGVSLLHECADRELYQECNELADLYADNHPKLYLQVLEQCKAGGQAKEGRKLEKKLYHALEQIGR